MGEKLLQQRLVKTGRKKDRKISRSRHSRPLSVFSGLADFKIGAGVGSVKSDRGFEVYRGCRNGLSAPPTKPSFHLNARLVLLTAAALIIWPLLGFSHPAKAGGAFTVADIQLALRGSVQVTAPQNSSQPQQYDENNAVSALAAFAQKVAAQAPQETSAKTATPADRPFDDATFVALRDFARHVGGDRPASLKDLPKVADADNAMDALREFLQKGSAPQAPAARGPKGPVAGGKNSSAPVEATYVGAKVCLGCHTTQAEAFGKTLMGRIGKTQQGKFDCENCHGPGSAHAKAGGGRGVGGIISFRPEDQARTAEENNAICLNCHQKGGRTHWSGSIHETRGLMCTNCHTIMKDVSRKNQLKTAFQPDTCFQCHKDRRSQMYRSSHMPIREGKVACSDCHNPHGSVTESLLKGESINATCYKCHAEKRGPFLFEHLPVRENCLNCHEPHGSINEFSLRIARPRMCYECHNLGHPPTGGMNTATTMGRSCQNCHTQIHGSNSPAGGAFQR